MAKDSSTKRYTSSESKIEYDTAVDAARVLAGVAAGRKRSMRQLEIVLDVLGLKERILNGPDGEE